ncbi:MAG: hypothetical protein AAFQ13_04615 [Pseudomonadota bacterium]
MILLAATASVLAANSVSAAPIAPAGPSAFEDIRAFAEGGSSQSRPKRARRVSPTGERAQAFQKGQGERAAQRTAVYERAATLDASDVQARLDAGEEAILNALAEAETAAIAQAANQIGVAAGDALAQAPGQYLNAEQMDTLVAAAARAAEIDEGEVDQLLKAGSLAIQSYEGLDADAIAANLNQIGNKALELQAASPVAKRP